MITWSRSFWNLKQYCCCVLLLLVQGIVYVSLESSKYYHSPGGKKAPEDNFRRKPHIVFILSDDLGWNDVSWHNPDMYMPTLDDLALTGVILEQYYTQASCTPSRAALHTGYYPFKIGFQHGLPMPTVVYGIASDVSKLPEKLRELGYRTHLVGKWHLGFCTEEYTPPGQGYDQYYGYYVKAHDNWYTHLATDDRSGNDNISSVYTGFDLRDLDVAVSDNSTYIDVLLRDRAVEFIEEIPGGQPMFLLFATNLVRAPLQVPPKFMELFKDVKDENRRIYSAMVAWLDESVSMIVEALKARGMWDNTLLIFASDNGGDVDAGGSNIPLRGEKKGLYEGGNRVPAFVHGAILEKTRYANQRLMHAVDWFNTLTSLAGGTTECQLDSLNVWPSLAWDQESPRQEVIYNIDTMRPCLTKNGECAAIRIGNYKLFVGDYDVSITPVVDVVRQAIQNGTLELYNLKYDPGEYTDLASQKFILVFDMLRKLKEYSLELVPPLYNTKWNEPTPDADPDNFGGVWSSGWC